MKMFELLPRPLGSIFRKLTHFACNSRTSTLLSNFITGHFDLDVTLFHLYPNPSFDKVSAPKKATTDKSANKSSPPTTKTRF